MGVAYRIVKLAWRSMPTLLRELKRQLDREGESELRRFAVKNAILAVQKARAPPGSFLSAGRSRLNPSAFVRMRPAVHFAFFSLTLTAAGEERSICRLCCRVPHACARLNEPRSADVRMRARGPSAARRAKAAARAEVGTPIHRRPCARCSARRHSAHAHTQIHGGSLWCVRLGTAAAC